MQEAHNYRKQDQLFHMVMHLPCALAGVSEAVQVSPTRQNEPSPLLRQKCSPFALDCALPGEPSRWEPRCVFELH